MPEWGSAISKLIIHRQVQREKYGLLDMRTIEDPRLTNASLGLLLYLISRPQPWETSIERLAKQRKSGKTAIESALGELQACGYMDKPTRVKGGDGKPVETVWTIYEISQKPDAELKPKKRKNTKQPENRDDEGTQSESGFEEDSSNIVSIKAYQPENPVDAESLAASYQLGNQVNGFYQPENRVDGLGVEVQSGQGILGSSYQPENRVVLKRTINNKNNHLVTPAKPVRGKEKSSTKNPSEPKVSPDARALVNHLSACLKEHGAKPGQFDSRWFFQGCAAAEEMLKLESCEDLNKAISYLVNDQFIGKSIVDMYAVKRQLPRWQRANIESVKTDAVTLTRAERLMQAKHLVNIFNTDEILETATLRIDQHKQLWKGEERIDPKDYEAIAEGVLAC